MAIQIDAITLDRWNLNDGNVVIDGSGFGALPANNDVRVSGNGATIVAASPTQITFTMPFIFTLGFVSDVHAIVQVENTTTSEFAVRFMRVKGTPAEVGDQVIDAPVPGPLEVPSSPQVPVTGEARDMERLAALIESFTRDLSQGDVLAWDGTKVDTPGNNVGAGQALLVDLAESTDLRWSHQQDVVLPFGGTVAAAAVLLIADGDRTATVGGTEGWAPAAGTIDLAWLLVKEVGADTLDRVRILVNSIAVFDSGVGLGIVNDGVFTATPALTVASGDLIELEASRTGVTIDVIGGLRLVLD